MRVFVIYVGGMNSIDFQLYFTHVDIVMFL
jgi:hypothetical protein